MVPFVPRGILFLQIFEGEDTCFSDHLFFFFKQLGCERCQGALQLGLQKIKVCKVKSKGGGKHM